MTPFKPKSLWDRLDELDARFDSVTGYEELSPLAPGQPVISFADSFKGGSWWFRLPVQEEWREYTCAADGEGRQPALSVVLRRLPHVAERSLLATSGSG